jgi:hypothetical protein
MISLKPVFQVPIDQKIIGITSYHGRMFLATDRYIFEILHPDQKEIMLIQIQGETRLATLSGVEL